jgi:hypothetical protein
VRGFEDETQCNWNTNPSEGNKNGEKEVGDERLE